MNQMLFKCQDDPVTLRGLKYNNQNEIQLTPLLNVGSHEYL